MNRQDWKQAMQNEADSVPDAKWAAETRWEARRRSIWLDGLLVSTVISGLTWFYWWVWLGMVRCGFHQLSQDSFGCWVNTHRQTIYSPANLVLFVVIGLLFGMFRIRVKVAGFLFLLSPVFAMAGAVFYQWLVPPADLLGIVDVNGRVQPLNLLNYTYKSLWEAVSEAMELTALIMASAWLGERLSHWRMNRWSIGRLRPWMPCGRR